ncbi:DNA-binding transcriptional regulator, MarR family [Paenibacillus jilunlii]|uniref:DNA-binding transcriptional regulator, MarR family n=2 Tax=Paenibacillus jilunlii TaxID=682956 RepID=A0A1G9HLH5_9BACL|nr:MarR family transcriptional regulator [Paenibacillus jilunlii]KWX70158.1 MarR family transcriptional regulator [Paenibacillus jilunlii]SDL13769.1 DNA-binding transcriptional regulator, MarR family [Paenibacillus jilunlii]
MDSLKEDNIPKREADIDSLQQFVLDLPLANEVFFALVETTAGLVAVSEKYWQAQGLNGARIRVLVEIAKQGGAILPSVLAERIGVTKANISLLLTPLEKDGYISRAGHVRDGRKTFISLTEAGRTLLSLHLPGNRETVAGKMNRLDTNELRQLMGLLQKLDKP